jgi:DNA-binding NarL/FixJ family response regulator
VNTRAAAVNRRRAFGRNTVIHRLLLVDDFEPWRRYLSAALDTQPEWTVSAEAADGLEAVRKARNLDLDLILLDVGLPGISGIDAARRIVEHNPDARILFVSEHRSWEIAEAALATGARGYVLKSDAGRELPLAMQTVVSGERFVSPRLGGAPFVESADVTQGIRRPRHEAAFLSDEAALIDRWACFAEEALSAGSVCLAFATEPHLARLEQRLTSCGVDVPHAIRAARYHATTVAEAKSGFIVDGWPDTERFWSASTTLFLKAAQAAKGPGARVAAFGEIAPSLWRDGCGDAALQVERLWDEFARTYDVEIFCGYSWPPSAHADEQLFHQICAEHSVVHSHG